MCVFISLWTVPLKGTKCWDLSLFLLPTSGQWIIYCRFNAAMYMWLITIKDMSGEDRQTKRGKSTRVTSGFSLGAVRFYCVLKNPSFVDTRPQQRLQASSRKQPAAQDTAVGSRSAVVVFSLKCNICCSCTLSGFYTTWRTVQFHNGKRRRCQNPLALQIYEALEITFVAPTKPHVNHAT